ncbi:hypothetical protein [Sphingobium estronivorans]|uniref:hypothetical protein n=1 Tax=Sphingobium estronivorans TaxID=1577690 RepID=UPI00123A5D8B|nr:hypothetical protein [Sphingobium estronivorans]
MRGIGASMRVLAAASTLFLVSSPALAGDDQKRALAAIAEARGKIDAAAKLNSGDVNPAVMAKAQASLRLAQEQLRNGKKKDAITTAIEAQQFADTAIGEKQVRAETDAQIQASTAASAQQDAAAANARADAAERAAASAASDAQAARAAAATPPPASTTVTTETVKTVPTTAVRKAAPVKHRVVRKTSSPARTSVVEKTTTTVTNR